MESGRNILRGCADKRVDLSVTREFRVGGHRRLMLRADVFNAFNSVIIFGRNNTVTFDNPTSMRVMNSQFNDDGSLNQNRLKPRDAGFGAANNAADMRNIQLQVRFSF